MKRRLITAGSECWDGTATMPVVYDDGGRSAAGYKGNTRDCVCRAVAIATGEPYAEVYAALNDAAKRERPRAGRGRSSARTGIKRATIRRYLSSLGWMWTPVMGIGTGCTMNLRADQFGPGTYIVSLSKHLTVVKDGVIHDTHNPQRATIVVENGAERIAHRCVYGYWSAGS